jgi:hypothetical protein
MSQKHENVRTVLENATRFTDFQAEYEGSIPFTRSSLFIDLREGTSHFLTISF